MTYLEKWTGEQAGEKKYKQNIYKIRTKHT